MKKAIRISAIIFALISFTFPLTAIAQEEQATDTTDKQVVPVWLHRNIDGDGSFYMWVQYPGSFVVKNTPPNLEVGYDFDGSLYIGKGVGHPNMMLFVQNYGDSTDKDYPDFIIAWFGGSRPEDIHIRLPRDYKARVVIH